MLLRMLELPADVRARYDTSSLRFVPLSGSALPGDLATRFMDAFGDVIYNLYGSTEVGSVSVATPADLRAAPATAGRPPRGTLVRLLDDDDRDVADRARTAASSCAARSRSRATPTAARSRSSTASCTPATPATSTPTGSSSSTAATTR